MSRLPPRLVAAYAAPGFAFALIGIPVYVHLPRFYGDTLGVPLSLVGAVILLSRAWDAVTDPAIGYLSDRTRTRLGRRRPFLFAGALPLAVSTFLLLAPPRALTSDQLGWWLAAGLLVMFLAWTAVQIPHSALGPELTQDHHGRTSLFAARDGLRILGTLAAAAAPSVARGLLGVAPGAEGDRAVFEAVAWVYAPLLVALPWLCAIAVREPAPARRPTATPWRVTADALGNRPFRILLVAYGIGALGGALPATLVLFYVEHVLRAPEWADALLGLYFLSGFVFLPLWTRVARRVGKKRAWLSAMAVNVGAFVFALLLGPGDTAPFALVCLVSGIGFGAGLVLPNSLVSDVVDYDEMHSGSRREGLYFGLWSIVTKLSAAVGAGLALPILDWAGYVPQGQQGESVILALRLLYAGVPCAGYVVGLVVAARFPIDERAHGAVREAVERRRRDEPFIDPLAREAVS